MKYIRNILNAIRDWFAFYFTSVYQPPMEKRDKFKEYPDADFWEQDNYFGE